MKPIIPALVALLLAGQASALSCVRPDPARTYGQVASGSVPYFILFGQLDFEQSALSSDPAADPVAATFRGKSLTADGFVNAYAGPLHLQVNCAASWCGSATSGTDALIFVQADQTPGLVTLEPCGTFLFENPDTAALDAVTRCMRDGNCSP